MKTMLVVKAVDVVSRTIQERFELFSDYVGGRVYGILTYNPDGDAVIQYETSFLWITFEEEKIISKEEYLKILEG